MSRIESLGRAVLLTAIVAVGMIGSLSFKSTGAVAAEGVELKSRLEHLSQNGNSNCSREFMESIAAMSMTARIKGSCCSPMDLHRYSEQVTGLEKYGELSAIPSDPYDIPAGLAQRAMSYYELELTSDEQRAYDYAMANSDEKGPCCCQCWRWKTYGGLAKLLIREQNFTGEQIAELWDLSDGCGGAGDHYH